MKFLENPLALALLSALLFGCWPVITRYAGLSTIWVALTVCIGTLLAVITNLTRNGSGTIPALLAIIAGIVGGYFNGQGMLVYSRLVSNRAWDLSIYGPISIGALVVFSFVFALAVFNEPITAKKLLGIFVICLGIYILNSK